MPRRSDGSPSSLSHVDDRTRAASGEEPLYCGGGLLWERRGVRAKLARSRELLLETRSESRFRVLRRGLICVLSSTHALSTVRVAQIRKGMHFFRNELLCPPHTPSKSDLHDILYIQPGTRRAPTTAHRLTAETALIDVSVRDNTPGSPAMNECTAPIKLS